MKDRKEIYKDREKKENIQMKKKQIIVIDKTKEKWQRQTSEAEIKKMDK